MKKAIVILPGTATAVVGLFWLAGTAAWWNGWAFLVFIVLLGIFTVRLMRSIPGLAEERRTAWTKAMPGDTMLVILVNLALPAMLVAAALDLRFRCLPAIPPVVSMIAFAAMIPAAALTHRAMAANPFFSSHIRLQTDRGQSVVSAGPYTYVRHPGYAGAVVFNLLVPFALGSWSASILGLAAAALLVYRTAREDRVLMAGLPGYPDYARQVRNRLIPGVW